MLADTSALHQDWLIVLHLPGMQPKAAPRPRVSGKHAYMPPEYMAFKKILRRQILAQGCRMLPGFIELDVTFIFDKPKKMVKPYPTQSDLDNLIKLPKDVLNGLAWEDDRLVVSESCRKRYGTVPGYLIKIRNYEDRRE